MVCIHTTISNMKSFIISYDIANPTRLRKVRKIVQEFSLGGQKSCYESNLDKSMLNALVQILSQLITNEDKINIINIEKDAILMGKAYQTEFENGGIIII
jgi:CRISPR-associated endonuclease Cas2